MTKKTKNILIVVVILLVGFAVFRLVSKPEANVASSSYYEQQVQAYNDNLKKQGEQFDTYMNKVNGQLSKVAMINDKSLQNQLRLEKILDRWEKQADKYDEILNKLDE